MAEELRKCLEETGMKPFLSRCGSQPSFGKALSFKSLMTVNGYTFRVEYQAGWEREFAWLMLCLASLWRQEESARPIPPVIQIQWEIWDKLKEKTDTLGLFESLALWMALNDRSFSFALATHFRVPISVQESSSDADTNEIPAPFYV
uniref:Uncharacterized protein n=1 Tax=Utricularia reniformis TaxID=192314 RepID=A0A1Y0AZ48_9LAMI|nr:hypothetical protein AEK19_MT0170 [Utricularia reniformis]ART30452.1 hypothetical protein AEK19_MT0170 [Utricularia reniformis]